MTKSPFSDRPTSGYYYYYYYYLRLLVHCINCNLFMSRKLYRSGTGRICIWYCTHISTRVILRSKRLDQSLGEDNFQIKLAKQSRPYTLHGHTRVHILLSCVCATMTCRRLSVLLSNGLSASFHIILQSIRRRSGPAAIFDPIASVYAGWREKIRKSITRSSAKYNFVASGDGVTTTVTLLLSRIHNKLISRRASHENIRKVFGICIRNPRWPRDGVRKVREQRAGKRV